MEKEFDNVEKLSHSASTEVEDGDDGDKSDLKKWRQQRQKLPRDEETFSKVQGGGRIGKSWRTDSIGYDGDSSWRETWKILAKCEAKKEFENVGKMTPSAATETAVGKHIYTLVH